MDRIVFLIYRMPLRWTLLLILAMVLAAGLLGVLLFRFRRAVRVAAAVLALLSLAAVLYVTLFRGGSGNGELILLPLYSLVEAVKQPEVYRTLLMNVFLFVPLGIALPFALPEKIRCKALLSIVLAAAFSLVIEAVQFALSLGRAELDDILMNSLGAAIGALAYFPRWVREKISKS